MRYLFNSFSLPDHDLPALLRAAHRYGYDGLELRTDQGHNHRIEVDTDRAFRMNAQAQIQGSGLTVDCLCLSAEISDPDRKDTALAQVSARIDLAADIGTPLVRVFGGAFPDSVSRQEARNNLIDVLQRLADHGNRQGVTVCLETHDQWTDPAELADIMTAVDHPGAGLIWDILHTSRRPDAALADTYRSLARWIRHVQMHDALLRTDRLEFRPIGRGEIDHLELLAVLGIGGYDGAIAGEWMNWEPGDIHLPREIDQMRRYETLLHEVTSSSSRRPGGASGTGAMA